MRYGSGTFPFLLLRCSMSVGPGEVDAWRSGRQKVCSYSVSIHPFLQLYFTPLSLASQDGAVFIGCRSGRVVRLILLSLYVIGAR